MLPIYLSDEWVAAADDLLRDVVVDPPLEGPGFTIETMIVDGDRERYVIEFEGRHVRARRPRPDEATTIRLAQEFGVAVAIATGERSAQAAFLAADIQLSGDVGTLIRHAALISQIGDALGPLRAATDFGPRPPVEDQLPLP